MDCTTGEVLALASAPTFDPNLFVRGISQTQWTGPQRGPVSAAGQQGDAGPLPAGLDLQDDRGARRAGGRGRRHRGGDQLHRPHRTGQSPVPLLARQGHGRVNLIEAISQSCDVFFYDLAQRVGIEAISAMAVRLGCGVRHDLPLSGIAQGLAPTMQWKRRNRGEDWVVGDTLNASIGQGFVLTSPLQLAVMTARLATGRIVEPSIVRSVDGVPRRATARRRARHFAGASRHHPSGDVAGEQRTPRNRLWQPGDGRGLPCRRQDRHEPGPQHHRGRTGGGRDRQRGSALGAPRPRALRGLRPFEAPRYAVSVVVEHGGGGAAVAGPIARDILLRAQVGRHPAARALPGVPAPRHRGDAPTPADPRGTARALGPRLPAARDNRGDRT
jgi:penicillin-binding protein 2